MKRWTKSMMAGLGLTVLGCVGCASDVPLEESNARESIKVAIKTQSDSVEAESASSGTGETAATVTDEIDASVRFFELSQEDGINIWFNHGWTIKDEMIYSLKDVVDSDVMQVYYKISIMNLEGVEQSSLSLPFHSYMTMNCNGIYVDAQNQIWLLAANFSEGDELKTAASNEKTPYHLMCFDQNGERKMDMILDEAAGIEQGEYSHMTQDNAGNIYIWESLQKKAIVLNAQGELQGVVSAKDGVEMSVLVCTKSGEIYGEEMRDGTTQFWKLQLDSMSFADEPIKIEKDACYHLNAGWDFDLIGVRDQSLVEISLKDGTVHERMNLMDRGIDGNCVMNVQKLDEDRLLLTLIESDSGTGKTEQVLFQRREKNPDLPVITIASLSADTALKDEIVDFNRTHSDMQIHLNEYYDELDANVQKEDALTRLNADIVAGTAGDILDIGSLRNNTSKRYYIEKGALANLYDYMGQEGGVKKEDLLSNLLEADEVDGGLYDLPFAFKVNGYAGKTSLVGDSDAWSWEQALECKTKQPEKQLFALGEISREDFLRDVLVYNQDSLVDWDTRNSQFGTDEFFSYLEYAKDYLVSEADIESVYAGNSQREKANEGSLLLAGWSLDSSMRQYREVENAFQESISPIGFPTIDGSMGAVFSPVLSLGILQDSEQKEIAWEFFEELLSEDFQSELDDFPVRKTALETWKQTVLEAETESSRMTYGELQQSQIDTVSELLTKVDKMADLDQNIYQIVLEEAAYYFADTKTVEETCDMIQNRVSLYLME